MARSMARAIMLWTFLLLVGASPALMAQKDGNPTTGVKSDKTMKASSVAETKKPVKIKIGEFDVVMRTEPNEVPWKPAPPYFQRSHDALSLSFDIHRAHESKPQ